MGRGARHLTEGEVAVWLQVTRNVVPLTERAPTDATAAEHEPLPARAALPSTEPVRPQRVFHAASYSPVPPAPTQPGLAPLERRFKRRVAGGQVGIDRALDLHGMTQARAHASLRAFLLDAQHGGAKLVLVVTGKGRGARASGNDDAVGVLRRVVPLWLRDPAWRGLVAGFEEAAAPHGGAGALYIRLRRDRRDG